MEPSRKVFFDGLREMERRVSRKSPFYTAKYVIGRPFYGKKEFEGWERQHVGASRQIWGLYKTRHLRPYKTICAIEWPRDTMKSALGQGFSACAIVDDPNIRILYDSDTHANAKKKMSVIRGVLEDRLFIELHGDLRGDSWNENQITVKRAAILSDPTISTSGVGVEKTGQHFEVAIPDDLQTEGNSQTPEQIEPVVRNWQLYESLVVSGGFILHLGTPWNFGDVGEKISQAQAEDYRHGRPQRIWINSMSSYPVFKGEDGKERFQESMAQFPGRLDLLTLQFKRATMSGFLFAANYLCRRVSEDSSKFKREWMQYHDKSKEELVAMGCQFYCGIDPSREGTWAGRDFDAIVVAAVTPDLNVYIVEALGLKVTRQGLFDAICKVAEDWPLYKVVIERRFQQHELASWLKIQTDKTLVRIPWANEELKQTDEEKHQRIFEAQLYFEKMKVWIRKSHTVLEDQLLRLGRAEHDDLPDAMAFIFHLLKARKAASKLDWWVKDGYSEAPEYQEALASGRDEQSMERKVRFMRQMQAAKNRKVSHRTIRHMGYA